MKIYSSIISLVFTTVISFLLLGLMSSKAFADYYLAGSLGINAQDDIDTDGEFVSDFVTGEVTGVSPPLTIPSGENVNWATKVDDGSAYSLVLGWKLQGFRLELEYASSDADVVRHEGVSAAGIDLSAIDAGILLSGNVGDLGVSVSDLVADGRGEIETSSFYVNAFYDFNLNSSLVPFVGVGLGRADTDVVYRPSDVEVINGGDSDLAYQVIGGVAYEFNEALAITASLRYRDSGVAVINSPLLNADFNLANESMAYDIGLRYSF